MMLRKSVILQKKEGLMRSIAGRRRGWKIKVSSRRKVVREMLELARMDDVDVKVSMIQALIPMGLIEVGKELQKEVLKLAGEEGRHGKTNVRWGSQPGSIYLSDQKVPIDVPRVRNKAYNIEIPLEYYRKLQEPYMDGELIYKKLLNGLTTHKYRESTQLIPEVFGMSASKVSRQFKRATEAKLKELQERPLDGYDFIAIFVDGKRYADDGLVMSMGVTVEGEKVFLGVEQMSTENSRSMEQYFEGLIERGLTYKDGLLFVVDGSKGIIKAVEAAFPSCAVIQRCQFHKIENVVSYLSKGLRPVWRAKLRAAYKQTKYESAKRALEKLESELHEINPSAAKSLKEGLEETLTLHRLGLFSELGKSFSSTNPIESVMSQLGQYTDKVDRWRGGSHIQRWTASGLLELEPRLNKVKGFRYLKLLKMKLKEEVASRQKKEAAGCATIDDLPAGIHLTRAEV